jgi:signal transduction histidine kinase
MDEISSTLALKRYRFLIEIARDLATTFDLDTLLRKIVRVAVQLVKAQAASILLYDPDKNELYFQAVTEPQNEALMRGIVVPSKSIAGWVAKHRQAVSIKDVHQDDRYFGHVEKTLEYQTRNLVATPMMAKDKLVGVLEVLNKTLGEFNNEDQEVLAALGAQAAVAIENSKLFQQSDLLSELIHELRTPLTSINAIAYLMQRPQVGQEERINLAATISSETNRLNELTTYYLDLSRLESGRVNFSVSTFHLQDLIKECVDIVQPKADEASIMIQINSEPNLPSLEADADKIKQVIMNLIVNAIKYNRTPGKIFIHTWHKGQRIFFNIQDTGKGISKEETPFIFNKFFRSKMTERTVTGTGLGLSICKRIVESHQGKIRVDSILGEGTTFLVELPLKSVLQ